MTKEEFAVKKKLALQAISDIMDEKFAKGEDLTEKELDNCRENIEECFSVRTKG